MTEDEEQPPQEDPTPHAFFSPPPELDFTELLARHAPYDWKMRFGVDTYEKFMELMGSRQSATAIVAVDIRRSTMLMKESSNLSTYVDELNKFLRFSSFMVRSFGGWFDKFTGDGFLAYWLFGPQFGGGWSPSNDRPSEPLARLLGVTAAIRGFFNSQTYPMLMRFSQNWPSGAGIAAGIDAGGAVMVEMGSDLTPVGPAVVGAVRMVESAEKDEIVVNINLAHRLHDQVAAGVWAGELQITPEVRFTKEYPEAIGGVGVGLAEIPSYERLIERFGGGWPEMPPTPPAMA